ncbi:hypothetical protein BH11ACT8_BH11ACT8_28430 [soil metagenome]
MQPDREAPAVPLSPQISADGRFYLDEGRWVPLPRGGPDRAAIAQGVAGGIGTFFAQLAFVVVVFPAITVAALFGVVAVVPDSSADVAMIATVVVLLGLLVAGLRALR